jgi:hypothetical protein
MSASLEVLKKLQFSFFGLRAVQVGRQKIPVVFTPTKKTPSNELSLLTSALYKISSVGNAAVIIAYVSASVGLYLSVRNRFLNKQFIPRF